MNQTMQANNEVSISKESGFFTVQDVLEAKKVNGAGLKLKKYDPFIFWDGMGESWFRMFDDKRKYQVNIGWIVDRLKLFQVNNLLEIGCGFGRILPFLLQAEVIKEATGIEISPKILKCSETYLNAVPSKNSTYEDTIKILDDKQVPESVKDQLRAILPKLKKDDDESKANRMSDFRDKINLKIGDARKLEFESESFDCVLSSECLQHLDLDDCIDACREMLRVSRDLLIVCERWGFPGEHSEPHMWSHNLNEIFRNLGAKVLQVTTIGPAMQGLVIHKYNGYQEA